MQEKKLNDNEIFVKDNDIWADAANRYKARKLKELIKSWQSDRKAQGLPWTIADLGEEINYHRNWITKWMNGSARFPIEEISAFFNVTPEYFTPQNLDELDLANKEHHKMMQDQADWLAKKCDVSQSFLWFLKSDQQLQDEIIAHQPTDALLNSFDKDVPDVLSPYQFINSEGEKIYLNSYTLQILGQIEPKVKEYIRYLLWSAYNKRKK